MAQFVEARVAETQAKVPGVAKVFRDIVAEQFEGPLDA